MNNREEDTSGLKQMIAHYMEEGLLENIVSMFKVDQSAYSLIGELITDERVRVRLGVTALVEILTEEDPDHILLAVESIIKSLSHELPNIRGDAVNLLGIIRAEEAIPILKKIHENDQEQAVREMAGEAIEEILNG